MKDDFRVVFFFCLIFRFDKTGKNPFPRRNTSSFSISISYSISFSISYSFLSISISLCSFVFIAFSLSYPILSFPFLSFSFFSPLPRPFSFLSLHYAALHHTCLSLFLSFLSIIFPFTHLYLSYALHRELGSAPDNYSSDNTGNNDNMNNNNNNNNNNNKKDIDNCV